MEEIKKEHNCGYENEDEEVYSGIWFEKKLNKFVLSVTMGDEIYNNSGFIHIKYCPFCSEKLNK